MKNSFLGELKDKIEKNLYTISDIMNCEFRLEAIKNKDNASEKSFLKKDIMPGIKNVLSAGELPALNTDFENYSKDGIIDDDLLAEYIDRNAYYVHRDLDISKTHVTVSVPLKIIFLNLKSLSDDQLNKITGIDIKSFLGEFKIGYREFPKEKVIQDEKARRG